MTHAAAYIRVSTTEQAAEGVSLDAQAAACRHYIDSRSWTLARTYQDVDTGRNSQRTAFVQLRDHLHEYGAVVCWKLDRIARRTMTALSFVEQCSEAGVAFVSITEAFDTSSPMGQAGVTIAAAFAQLESDTISQRIRMGKAQCVATGRIPWAIPYGYQRHNGSAEIHESEAEVIRRVYRERAMGLTHREIAAALVREKIGKRGQSWTRQKVSWALADPAYTGAPRVGQQRRVGRGYVTVPLRDWQPVPGLLPPIIEQAQWDEVQATRGTGRKPSRSAVFRGLLVCGACGTRWYVVTHGYRATAYKCTGRMQHRCSTSTMKEDVLRGMLEGALDKLAEPGAWAEVQASQRDTDGERLEVAEQRCARAWTAYVEGGVGLDVVRAAQVELGDAETAMQMGQVPPVEGRALREAVAACRRAVKVRDIEEGNRELRRVIARLVVHQERVEVILWAT